MTPPHRTASLPTDPGFPASRQAVTALTLAVIAVAALGAWYGLTAAVLGAGAAGVGLTCGMLWPRGTRATGATDTGRAELTTVLEGCEDAIVLTDPNLRIWYANPEFAKLCGRTVCADAGTTIAEALAHRITDGATFAHNVAELVPHPAHEATGEVVHLGTPARAFEWHTTALRTADGTMAGRAFLFRDRSQARELAGLKSDFLSTVTHELRTPLTSVKGSLQLVLSKSSALSPIDCELLNISLKNADRLIRLINDLLDISRLELGKIELTFAKVPTESLIEETVAGLRAYAGGRAITIDCEVEADVPAIEGDRDRLIQVLTNLVSNAVKFSPASGRVLVRATRYERDVAIAVRDWGIGIRLADQDRLFQRFQRLNPGHSDEPSTGLGLAISKAIVDRHGGRISVASSENAGSTFTVLIPAVDDIPAAAPRAPEPAPAEPPTVLLVDDDEALARTLQAAWNARYRLVHVPRGADALDIARIHRPDAILLDVVLPDLSGYDVLRILRNATATATIPVVMLTVQPERALATNLGAVDVVGKPADVPRLTSAIEHALGRRRGESGLCIAVGAYETGRSELIATLRSHGHQVYEARDDRDLLRCADQHGADVAVVGPDAASGSSARIVQLLRDHPSTRSLPVVLLEEGVGDAGLAGCTWMAPDSDAVALLQAIELAGRRRVAA